jgi:hypothetical protein
MADLNDDRKKEEEEYGGFEPDENDDESFMLEDENDYPAKLPDKFSDEPSSTVRVTASVDSANNDEEENDEEETEESSESEEETDEAVDVEDDTAESEIEEITTEEIDSENTEVESEAEEVEDETVEFDDDFKKKLQADIEKSKAKREAKEVLEEPPADSEPAKQIGDDAETVVNLSDIDADKPSNVKKEEVDELPPIVDSEPNLPEPENTEEEKKKKTPVWILMLYSSVATLLVTLGAVWLIWAFLLSDTEEHDPDETENQEIVSNHEEHKPENKKKTVTSDSISEEEKKWLDSMDIDNKDTLITYQEDKEFFAGLEDEFDEEGISKDKPEDKIVEKNEPKKAQPKVVPKKKKKDDIASNNVTKTVTPKENKKSKVEVDESEFSMPQPKGPAPETGLFMVQIYSSPSREDAESWLGQLKARQVPNPMITEHELKGRTWYRVRYGRFETKEAARSSALELGYSQSWIDRVK